MSTPPFIFYDTETTGTQIDKDRVIEIAAYNSSSGESFVSYVNPEIPIPEDASKIHGIYQDMVVDAPKFPEVFQRFREFCGADCMLVAHNNDGFDLPLLNRECQRHSVAPLSFRSIDSLKWAKKYRPDLPKHNLQYLRQVYGIEENRAHRALDDVLTLHKVFSALIGDLSSEQVFTLLNEAPPPAAFRMPFGKHAGKLISEIPASYIAWLESSDILQSPDNQALKEAILSLKNKVS